MKVSICGNTRDLKPRTKTELERLAQKRSAPSDVVDSTLAKRAAAAAAELGRMIGVLIGRDGRASHVVVGTRQRLYLPDLGRFRLDKAKLRRVRLVVFAPGADEQCMRQAPSELWIRRDAKGETVDQSLNVGSDSRKFVLSPEVPLDLLTDLEKLRLDGLLYVAVSERGDLGPCSFAHVEVLSTESPMAKASDANRHFGISFERAASLQKLDVDFALRIDELENRLAGDQRVSSESAKGDQVILIGAYTGSAEEARRNMDELRELARTAGLTVVDELMQRRTKLDPKTIIGSGKLEDITLHCLDRGVDLIVFDCELSPGQLRSITNATELRVVDRSMLIMDIFAQRAKTSEGRLQVELAQLKYSLPRLTERDSGLSRLTGGIGGRGPGETKLEISRRRTRQRIADLEKKIDSIAGQRTLRRSRRQQRGVPVVAIVGYTNAGKSTLLNALTNSEVLVESKLFATLDLASRRMRFPNEKEVIFVDTVGFIRELPKELVNAFRATLEEVGEADLLLHVADACDPELGQKIETVERTLSSLGFEDKPRCLVLNKVDELSEMELRPLLRRWQGLPISALNRDGFKDLISNIQTTLADSFDGADPGQFLPAAS
ncbi:MAG: GTPase HflX [Bdellovibrionales bacterium]|nr:GTPase HflX [Bdellovibrionales bacterium]